VTTAIAFGLLAGAHEIANTSIGWHLASGHWILSHHAIPHSDPFSFTAQGIVWIDHEWLFQVIVALTEKLGGAPLLVVLRALLVAAVSLMLLVVGIRSGLSPPAALLLTAICVYCARIRFFLRPELFTLLIVPAVMWIFISRHQWADRRRWLGWLAALMVVAVNIHGGALVIPPLLAAVLAAELLRPRRSGGDAASSLKWGAAGLAAVSAVPILNPSGWKLYTVPLSIAHLVDLPHIPNPEWISPTFSDVPALYVGLGLGLLILALKERNPVRWVLFLTAGVLAIRYVRNVGLFFVLLPIAVAPALARLTVLGRDGPSGRQPRWRLAAVAVAALVALSMLVEPGRAMGLGFSDRFYPQRACEFIERNGFEPPRYNDVRFGGYLIHRYHPPGKVFLDDRNEVHEALLSEIFAIFQRSDPAAWQAMLDRHAVATALLRYNPPFTVARPDGEVVGRRGFSTLWFPDERWALVYWDDTAMVLVDRRSADPARVARHEYRHLRPDDIEHLTARLAGDPEYRSLVATELAHKLREDPSCQRALMLWREVLGK
jgi:hypothetical protein